MKKTYVLYQCEETELDKIRDTEISEKEKFLRILHREDMFRKAVDFFIPKERNKLFGKILKEYSKHLFIGWHIEIFLQENKSRYISQTDVGIYIRIVYPTVFKIADFGYIPFEEWKAQYLEEKKESKRQERNEKRRRKKKASTL